MIDSLGEFTDDPNSLVCRVILLEAWARAGTDIEDVEDEALDLLEYILG